MTGNAPQLGMPVAEMFSDELRECIDEEDLIPVSGMVVKNVVGNLLWVFSCDGPVSCIGDGTLHKEPETGGDIVLLLLFALPITLWAAVRPG